MKAESVQNPSQGSRYFEGAESNNIELSRSQGRELEFKAVELVTHSLRGLMTQQAGVSHLSTPV